MLSTISRRRLRAETYASLYRTGYDIGPIARLGPVVGRLGEQTIHEWVVDMHGRRFRFAGVAPILSCGRVDLEALRPGEMIFARKLLYKLA